MLHAARHAFARARDELEYMPHRHVKAYATYIFMLQVSCHTLTFEYATAARRACFRQSLSIFAADACERATIPQNLSSGVFGAISHKMRM